VAATERAVAQLDDKVMPRSLSRAVIATTEALRRRSMNDRISDLTSAHNTVKSHVRALYGKLGVNSRRDAVATARRCGLLRSDAP
jgi:DNA-binding NarL/FixJ family response regulator